MGNHWRQHTTPPREGRRCVESSDSSKRGWLFGQRHGGDGFENTTGDFVGVALGVGTAIFQVAFVSIFRHVVRETYGVRRGWKLRS